MTSTYNSIRINFSEVDNPMFFSRTFSIHTHRKDKLEILKQYFLRKLCEDRIDGNHFDLDVLEMIENLQRKYEYDEIVPFTG